jgi:hypothetical protein
MTTKKLSTKGKGHRDRGGEEFGGKVLVAMMHGLGKRTASNKGVEISS